MGRGPAPGAECARAHCPPWRTTWRAATASSASSTARPADPTTRRRRWTNPWRSATRLRQGAPTAGGVHERPREDLQQLRQPVPGDRVTSPWRKRRSRSRSRSMSNSPRTVPTTRSTASRWRAPSTTSPTSTARRCATRWPRSALQRRWPSRTDGPQASGDRLLPPRAGQELPQPRQPAAPDRPDR